MLGYPVIILRKKEPDRVRGFKLPWVPLAPLWLAAVYAINTTTGVATWLHVVITMLSILGVAMNIAAWRAKRSTGTIPSWLKTDLALAGIASCIYLMDGLPAVTWGRFGIWLAIGMLVYFSYGYRRSRLRSSSL